MKHIFTVLLSIISLTTFGQNWDEVIKAVASDREADDFFGFSVDISDDKAIVGAFQEGASAGAAYIFELNGGVWSETFKLVASDGAVDDRFGYSVSISGDKVIIGAYQEDEDASGGATLGDAGSAYVFELSGGVWTETAKLVASDRGASDLFGRGVSISGDRVIVGANQEDHDLLGVNSISNSGSAYIFDLSGGVWSETAKLVSSDRAADDFFGLSVDISGDKAIVSSYLDNHNETGGAILNNVGSAYIFELSGGVWSETAKLFASDGTTWDSFGFSVSIDGDKVVAGAHRQDRDASGGTALSDAGAAYIFELSGGVWTETAKLVASDRGVTDLFGVNVSISGDRVVVGANQEDEDATGGTTVLNAGSAYVFELIGGVWTEASKLVASDRAADDLFGRGVAISGNRVIVGAYREDENVSGGTTLQDPGSVYMFMTCNENQNVSISGNIATAQTVGVTYQWLDCDNGNAVIASETNQSFTASVSGNYAVVVTEGNCTDTSTCVNLSTVSVYDLGSAMDSYQLYPNPTTEKITIYNFDLFIDNITIVDVTGKLVKSFTPKRSVIDVSMLQKGIYFVKIQHGEEVVTQKMVKQ